jgi:hypothetical protein
MEVQSSHFWDMAREIPAYCKDTGLRVVALDNPRMRTFEFETEVSKDDPRHRHWHIRLTDMMRTVNKREGGYDGGSEEDMIKIKDLMRHIDGRPRVANLFSTGRENG